MNAVKIRLEIEVEFDPEAWEHTHGGEWPLTRRNAFEYIGQMFDADGKGTGITKVTGWTEDDGDETCPDCGEPLYEDDDQGEIKCPHGCEHV